MQIKGCPAWRDYDVFGIPNEGCCFCYMTYCKDVKKCLVKEIIRKCEDNDCIKSKEILDILRKGD